MGKLFLLAATTIALATNLSANEHPTIGVVNFASCITESKAGKKEQESMDLMRKQMASAIESKENELREIASRFEDPEYLDSLSPKAEEEMKIKFQTLQEDLQRHQNQFYQVLNYSHHQMIQKINTAVSQAAEKIASEKNIDYVLNKEACFYINPKFELTALVRAEMDKNFETELSDNSDTVNELQSAY